MLIAGGRKREEREGKGGDGGEEKRLEERGGEERKLEARPAVAAGRVEV